MTALNASRMKRYSQVARLLYKYRNASVLKLENDLQMAGVGSDSDEVETDGLPEELVRDLQALGPVFIKIGQSLSTRPDLVREPYRVALARMQDDCEPLSYDDVRSVVEESLEVPPERLFQTFEQSPIASASLGQVHRARLRDGKEVAVKVQRPGSREVISGDMDILTELAERMEQHSETGRQFGLSSWVAELRRSLIRELDYEAEASNLDTLSEILEPYPELTVPKPVWGLSKTRVLTMDYKPGRKLSDISPLARLEHDGEALAEPLIKAFLDQLFIHGFVHVDPHPGNVLLTDEQQLVLLDLGMVTFLSADRRHELLSLVLAVTSGRGEEAAQYAIDLGEVTDQFDRAALVRDISTLVTTYSTDPSRHSAGIMLLEMTSIAARCGVKPPAEAVLLGKTLLNLEFLTTELAPDLSLRRLVNQHLGKVMRHRLAAMADPSRLAFAALETQKMTSELPKQLSRLLDALSKNEFKIQLEAFDELRFAASLQKIANRVSVALIVSALIVSAAMLMRIETEATLWGYPALALVLFLAAGLLGFGLVLSVLWFDRER